MRLADRPGTGARRPAPTPASGWLTRIAAFPYGRIAGRFAGIRRRCWRSRAREERLATTDFAALDETGARGAGRPHAAAAADPAHAAGAPAPPAPERRAARPAGDAGPGPPQRRRPGRAGAAPPAAPAPARRRAVRHLGVDGGVRPGLRPVPPRGHARGRPAHRGVHVRDPADAAHARAPGPAPAGRARCARQRPRPTGAAARASARRSSASSTTTAGGASARGAVVVIVSDGWERDDPALLGEQIGAPPPPRAPCRVGEPPPRRPALRAAHRRHGRRAPPLRRVRQRPHPPRPRRSDRSRRRGSDSAAGEHERWRRTPRSATLIMASIAVISRHVWSRKPLSISDLSSCLNDSNR